MTHEEKLEAARKKHGKPFCIERTVQRKTPPSIILQSILERAKHSVVWRMKCNTCKPRD
jgi:hypothetical protein